jgi:hypothetical protein
MNFRLKKATALLCLATTLAAPAVLAAAEVAQPIEISPATLRLAANQAPPAVEIPPEIRQIREEESEYSRKRTAALSKMGTGTIFGSLSIAAAAGLAVLGWNKNEDEEERGVPEDERNSGYYFLGALAVGIGGSSWGFSLRRKGRNELNALDAQKITFGIDGKGNPRLAYVLSLP